MNCTEKGRGRKGQQKEGCLRFITGIDANVALCKPHSTSWFIIGGSRGGGGVITPPFQISKMKEGNK